MALIVILKADNQYNMINYPTIFIWLFMGLVAGAGFWTIRSWAIFRHLAGSYLRDKRAYKATFGLLTHWAEYLLDRRRSPQCQIIMIS
jgi:hypothetical protein